MKIVSLITLFTLATAFDAIDISFYGDDDCQISQGGSLNFTDQVNTWYGIEPFQSFRLNRTLTQIEQLDFSTTTDDQICTEFIESYWNLRSSCRALSENATCVHLWTNSGLLNGTLGPGWGLNDTTWVKWSETGN